MLGLYIHIPFCVRKCRYCDFLSAPACDSEREAYLKSLHGQIKAIGERLRQKKSGKHYIVDSIFIGGGTPSLLSSDQMQALMDVVRESFYVADDAEITAECNPGTVTRKKLCAYKRAGINRLSIGLQSADNEELALLGRIHTWEEFLDTFKAARNACFTNINIDIMSALPGQTVLSYQNTLTSVLALHPEHISAYSLIIEEGTPFFDEYGETDCAKKKKKDAAKLLPSEDEVVQMDELTWKLLGEAGYEHYEISNYAKEGMECRHNLGYWERKNYLGLGLGASSLLDNRRYSNTENLREYTECAGQPEKIRKNTEHLTEEEQMEEFIFLGLRKMNGISGYFTAVSGYGNRIGIYERNERGNRVHGPGFYSGPDWRSGREYDPGGISKQTFYYFIRHHVLFLPASG